MDFNIRKINNGYILTCFQYGFYRVEVCCCNKEKVIEEVLKIVNEKL